MITPVVFAYASYFCFLLCIVFCVRHWVQHGWRHGAKQIALLFGFCAAFYLLESWAEFRTPFYAYDANFPQKLPIVPFGWLEALLGALGLDALQPFLSSDPLPHDCHLEPAPDFVPLCIPVSGANIAFAIFWSTRMLVGTFALSKRLIPITVPLIVGLMALWMDLSLDPALTTSHDCDGNFVFGGLKLWIWQVQADLTPFWFHIPLYNYSVWFAGPAILAALAILAQWFVLRLQNPAVATGSALRLRLLVLFLLMFIFTVAPNSSADQATTVSLMFFVVAMGLIAFLKEWPDFVRDNPVNLDLVAVLSFYFVVPVLAFIGPELRPLSTYVWLLLEALLIAGWGVFFAVSPYWQRGPSGTLPMPIAPIIAVLAVLMVLFAYLSP